MTIEQPIDRDIFLAYLDHVLCPKLRPGDVVVMDTSMPIRWRRCARIAAAAAELLSSAALLARSERDRKAWSKLKTLLRSVKARTQQTLDQALADLLPRLTPENAQA